MDKNVVFQTQKLISEDSEGIHDINVIREFERIGATHIGVYLGERTEDCYYLLEAALVVTHKARYDNLNIPDECTGSCQTGKYITVYG